MTPKTPPRPSPCGASPHLFAVGLFNPSLPCHPLPLSTAYCLRGWKFSPAWEEVQRSASILLALHFVDCRGRRGSLLPRFAQQAQKLLDQSQPLSRALNGLPLLRIDLRMLLLSVRRNDGRVHQFQALQHRGLTLTAVMIVLSVPFVIVRQTD
jgi:hypothetical protein